MPFSRLVEVGRVCMINFGKEYGQLVVIADVVDQAYALADNTVTGQRGKVLFKRLTVTPHLVDIERGATKAEVKKAVASSGALKAFGDSKWGKKLAAREAKAAMTDFDRYKARVKKSAANAKVRAALAKM